MLYVKLYERGEVTLIKGYTFSVPVLHTHSN